MKVFHHNTRGSFKSHTHLSLSVSDSTLLLTIIGGETLNLWINQWIMGLHLQTPFFPYLTPPKDIQKAGTTKWKQLSFHNNNNKNKNNIGHNHERVQKEQWLFRTCIRVRKTHCIFLLSVYAIESLRKWQQRHCHNPVTNTGAFHSHILG